MTKQEANAFLSLMQELPAQCLLISHLKVYGEGRPEGELKSMIRNQQHGWRSKKELPHDGTQGPFPPYSRDSFQVRTCWTGNSRN